MMQLYNSLSPSDRIQAVVDYCTTLLTTTLMGGTTNIMEKLQLEGTNGDCSSSVRPLLPKFIAVHIRVERDWLEGYCQAREIKQG